MPYSVKYRPEMQEEVIRLRLEALNGNKGWDSVFQRFPNIPKSSLKDIYYRWKSRKLAGSMAEYVGTPDPTIIGGGVVEGEIDEDHVWDLAKRKSRRRKEIQKKRQNHKIMFNYWPICLVFMADLHLGSEGVDYDRIDRDIKTILSTPGMYVVLMGDMLDNFIIGKLKQIRLGTSFSVSEEWALVKRVLRLLAPKILVSVSGNHDLWTYALTNIDYLEDVHKRINPNILYSKYQHNVDVHVGKTVYSLKVRHTWKGYSQYNPTHGIEHASKFNKGDHFDIGVMAHTHVSGLYRAFNNGGFTGHAVCCGSYKFDDSYARRLGLAQPNESAAVSMILSEDCAWGTNSLEAVSQYMRVMYTLDEHSDNEK
jgi:hypothetical protein